MTNEFIEPGLAKKLACLELCAFLYTKTLKSEVFNNARIIEGTPIYDICGHILFYRFPIKKDNQYLAYVDIAVSPAYGHYFIALTEGPAWDIDQLFKDAALFVKNHYPALMYTGIRFVAYSFPKIALQYINFGKEVLMLELFSYRLISMGDNRESNGGLECWSFYDMIPDSKKAANKEVLKMRISEWKNNSFLINDNDDYNYDQINLEEFKRHLNL